MHIYIYTHKRHTKKGAAMQTVEGLRIQSSERRAVGFRCGFHSAFKGSIPWRRVPLKGSIRVTIRDLKGTIIM